MTTVPLGIVSVTERQASLVNEALRNHRLSYGPMTRQLESRLAEIHGVKHAVFMASGTCALQVALEAAKELHGWKDGAEVIIPATTFIATMSSVIHAGLTPVLCDVEWETFGIAPGQIDQHVTPRTVAVLPVHLLGQAANMGGIAAEAERLNLKVIEDCCEAVGVNCGDQPVGSFGIAGALSSYVCHHFSTGVGGAVLTNDDRLATVCRSLMQHGRDPSYLCIEDDNGLNDAQAASMMRARYSFERWGHSYRSTELEASLGVGAVSESQVAEVAAERKAVARKLIDALEPWRDWIAPANFDTGSSPLFYPLLTRNEETCDGLSEAFERAGIETRPMMPLLTQKIVLDYLKKRGKSEADFPVAADLRKRAFIIGCHSGIGDEQIELIRRTTDEYFAGRKLVHRIYVADEQPQAMWSQAWCGEQVARGQHELASAELSRWLAGEPHPAFDAFCELLGRCELSAESSVLEIGCGCGYYQRVADWHLPGVRFTGVDVSPEMIDFANSEYQFGTFAVAKAEELPFANGEFDCAVLGSVIGCCDDWQAAVREAFRVSKRYVMLHRAAVHNFSDADDVRTSIKHAYGQKMAERIIREKTLMEFCEPLGVRVGDSIIWSKSTDGFQASYLWEARK